MSTHGCHEFIDWAFQLTAQEVAQMSGLEKDYPKLEKKAVDCPYPPYPDSFSQEQHQYGQNKGSAEEEISKTVRGGLK